MHLYAPADGGKIFTGKLKGRENGEIVILENGSELRFPVKDVSLVKRTIIWN